MGIRDDQLDALPPALDQALQKSQPERLGFGGAKAEADNLAPAFGRDSNGDYCGNRDDAAALAYLQVGGVEPQIAPFALDRPLQESRYPLLDILAQLGNLALRDAGKAHRLHKVVDAPSGYAANPSLLDHANQRFLGDFARLQKGRKRKYEPWRSLGMRRLRGPSRVSKVRSR